MADAPATESTALKQFEREMLSELSELRGELERARTEFEDVVKQRDDSLAKVKHLEEENGKQAYRIDHLVRALDEAKTKTF